MDRQLQELLLKLQLEPSEENAIRFAEAYAAYKETGEQITPHISIKPLESFPPDVNPYRYDAVHMGEKLANNIEVMHASPRPDIDYLIVVERHSGERVMLNFTRQNPDDNQRELERALEASPNDRELLRRYHATLRRAGLPTNERTCRKCKWVWYDHNYRLTWCPMCGYGREQSPKRRA